jgi:pyruvate dehydrogenase E1 component alpha subunit
MVAIDFETDAGRQEALEKMLLIRRFEERASDLFADGEIPGFVHLYIGQEAVAVGATGPLGDDDTITSTHRGHGHCLAMDLDPKRMMAELYGSVEGFSNGKGGSMHIADVEAGMLGANGIVGAGAPLATGTALSATLKDQQKVALAFYGDGGVSQGQVHESINMAAAWDLPVIFVVEKNQYVEMMPASNIFGNPDYHDSGAAYDIPAEEVDGMNVEGVYGAVEDARARALAGEGPSLVVAETYRYGDHSEGVQGYRSEEEEQSWLEKDPISDFKNQLIEAGTLTEGEFEEMESAIEQRLDEAVAYARDAPRPEPGAAYDDIFTEPAPDVEYHRAQLRGE